MRLEALANGDEQRKTIQKNDPEELIRRAIDEGANVSEKVLDDTVKKAVNTGLLQLSEVAFVNRHQVAIVTFSFQCGMMCGHGATLVFEKVRGRWKEAKGRQCSSWIS